MKKAKLERLPVAAAVLLVVLIGACTIPLREDESETMSAGPADQASDPLITKLAACRSVTYEQKDALLECRKAWAEKRRQFIAKPPSASTDNGAAQGGSSLFVPPKDEDRLPSGSSSIQQLGKE